MEQFRESLTVAETAARLNITPRTVRRLIAKGEIPAFKVGHSVRVDGTVLEHSIDRMTRAAVLA